MKFILRQDTRYNFCDINGKKFRATVIEVLTSKPFNNDQSEYKTLRLKHYVHENGSKMNGTVSMPYNWIVKADTLEDILRDDNVLLPSEILLEINDFN
jgi:hypothetical protein